MTNSRTLRTIVILLAAALGVGTAAAADRAVGRFVEVVSYAHNARQVADFADNHLSRLCCEYQFNPAAWNRVPVTVRQNRPGYGEGYAVIAISSIHGQYCERVEITESFPLVMSHALPHELTHVWVAYAVKFPFSTWLNESLATTNEDENLIKESVRRALAYLKLGRVMPPLYYINLDIEAGLGKRPRAERDSIIVYYAAACAFASFCYDLPGGKPNYLRFCSRLSGTKTVTAEKFQTAICDFYGFSTEEELNSAFSTWLSNKDHP